MDLYIIVITLPSLLELLVPLELDLDQILFMLDSKLVPFDKVVGVLRICNLLFGLVKLML